jgi:cell division protein FtsL
VLFFASTIEKENKRQSDLRKSIIKNKKRSRLSTLAKEERSKSINLNMFSQQKEYFYITGDRIT